MERTVSKAKPSQKRIALVVVCAVLLALMTGFWILFAYIQVNKVTQYGYNVYAGYRATRYIAHRGESAKYFDNTQESFISSASNPFFYAVETDIRLTKDGVWVCSHDDNPFLDKSVRISASTYDEIKDLPLDVSGARQGVNVSLPYTIPTYELYLEILDHYGKRALIEIKGTYDRETLSPVVTQAVETLGLADVTFGSFSLESLRAVYETNAYVRMLAFTGNALSAYCYAYMGRSVGVDQKILSKTFVDTAHKQGNAVFVYTVSDKVKADEYAALQADFIITNGEFAA